MRSLLMKSAVALSLIASPTVALAQTTTSTDREGSLAGLFAVGFFAVVLLVYASTEGGNDPDTGGGGGGPPVSP